MKLSCTIEEVNLTTRDNYFVVVQVQQLSKIIKFRTQIIRNTLQPQFYKNFFKFKNLDSSNGLSLKLGLFKTTLQSQPIDQTQVLLNSKALGITSLKLTSQQIFSLLQKENNKYQNKFIQGKVSFGTISYQIKIQNIQTQAKNSLEDKQLQDVQFNPYEKNQYLIQSNIAKLEELVNIRLQEYHNLQEKWTSINNTQKKVNLTEIKLQDHVQKIQKYNLQLNAQLNSKIDPQTMLASIGLLQDSAKGQMLLLQKAQYAKERLKLQKQEHQMLVAKFKQIQPVINQQINKVEKYNQLARDVKDQQFQIQRNNQLLKVYEDRMQKLRANDYTIKALKQNMKKSDLTAKQALILLQDVKYKAKLKEYSSKEKVKPNYQNAIDILQKIECLTKVIDKQQQQYQFTQPFEIKLQALRDEISLVEKRINDMKK